MAAQETPIALNDEGQLPVTTGLRVAVVQQVLPHYRVPFFSRLAEKHGIDLTVFADMNPRGSLKSAQATSSFRVVDAPLREIGPMYSQPAVLEVARSAAFDVAVLTWNARCIELPAALFPRPRRGPPVALWGHGLAKRESTIRLTYRKWLLSRSTLGILYNHSSRQRLIGLGVPPDGLFVAPNAIDQSAIRDAGEAWRNRPPDLENFRRFHHLNPERTAIFVSRLEPSKGIIFLLRSFKIVLAAMPDATLVVIGDGPQMEEVREAITGLGMAGRVVLVGASYDEAQIAPWMLSSACFICPRAVGLSILHAYGYAVPCITSDDLVCHGPEIDALRPGENGLLYRNGDSRALADAIIGIFSDPVLRASLSECAEATVREGGTYSIDVMCNEYVRALKHCAATQSRRVGPGRWPAPRPFLPGNPSRGPGRE